MRTRHLARLVVAVLTASLLVPAGAAAPALAAGGPNLAAGAPTSASSANGPYVAGNVTDGDQGSYWEGTNHAFPQWVQVDLGSSTRIDQLVLRLPASWEPRTQTLSVQGSADGTGFSTLVTADEYSFGPAGNNTATIDFPVTDTRFVRVHITANTTWPAAQLSELEVYGATGSSGNLAAGRSMSASSTTQAYLAANANDGNPGSYWESANHAFPQWLQVDLGASVSVHRVVLRLPAGWEPRTQTLAVQGSDTGSSFSDIVAPGGYDFAGSNTVTIDFDATTTRYLRLHITANTGWPAGQLSELEVYGPATGDTEPPSAPSNLAYTQPASGQIALGWDAATDNVAVTGYDIYANGSLRTSVGGDVLTYTDSQPDSLTVTYVVRARDAAGNRSADSNPVTRDGSSGDTEPPSAPADLAYTEPGPGQIALSWQASVDNVGVVGYDIYANGSLRASVAGDVLSHTDSQPDSATVTYYVQARDAAGNQSANSNTVTRTGDGGEGTNLAVGKPISSSGHTFTFAPENANDDDLGTYWEGSGGYPQTLTVQLGANAELDEVVVALDPASVWGPRTQTIQVLGRDQDGSPFTSLVPAAEYSFHPDSGNRVTIPVSGTAADLRLRFTSNTGAPGGQVAEFQVIGTPAPNPDLTVTGLSHAPASPVETDEITLTATVRNDGQLAAAATSVSFLLDTELAGTAPVGALAPGESATVSAGIGTRPAGSYPLTATVDPGNGVIEQNETNNRFTAPAPLEVAPVQSADLVASPVSWTPDNPAGGDQVMFSVAIRNQGTVDSTGGAHGITLTVLDDQGGTVRTLTGAHTGTIAAGATTSPVGLGGWTAADGQFTVRVVLAADGNELPIKRDNNTSERSLFVGRGANMPYQMYEAEDGSAGGGADVIGPNRTVGDPAGEASGRRAVTLDSTGAYVEWTTDAPTNTLVTRFSIPDAPGGGGTDSTLTIYVDGSFHKAIDLTSRFAWVYGAEASPVNSPGAGPPRHIYDEANVLLDGTVPAGSTIRLQKDPANGSTYTIDFINLELASPRANPDPARYAVPAGFTHQDVQTALDAVRMDGTGTLVGVYLPPGTYDTSQKFQVYGKPVEVVGAGVWYTRFRTPPGQSNTDAGFRVESSANGSRFAHFGFFGNYTTRIDGPGKVWDLNGVSDLVFDDIWVEHQVCMFWGAHVSDITIQNSRVRNLWADATNMTNESTGNLVRNNDARSAGDDAFALFSATDAGGSGPNHGNVFENLSATLNWRAAGLAVYGGFDNVFRNIHIADTLVYSGITISSLDFGFPFIGFGADPPTRFENISILRSGGHFWGAQTFPGIWVFSASKEMQGIRVSNVDIVDPTYHGIMFQTQYLGGQPVNPITDTVFTDVTITGAQRSGDEFEAKSGFGIWANELPEAGQGPAVGSATFHNLTLADNHIDIRNTTSTFTITVD